MLESLASLQTGGLIIGIVFVIFLFVAAVAVGFFFLYRTLQFKIPVIIHKANDKGEITNELIDRARPILSKGRNLLQFKKLKETINNPPADYQVPRQRGGYTLYFRWDGGHAFQPQKLAYNSPLTFHPAQYNMLQQMTIRQREANKRHSDRSFWQEYGHVVAWMIFVVLTSITFWIMFTKLEVVAASINNLANSVKEVRQVVG